MQLDNLIQLPALYLNAIATMCAADKLSTVQQAITQETGRLYMIREGTTIPEVVVEYFFERDEVRFTLTTRQPRRNEWTIKYYEGLDAVLREMQMTINTGRLAAPSKQRAAARVPSTAIAAI